MECRTCEASQPYTNHVCIRCGKDPWSDPNVVEGEFPPLPMPPTFTSSSASSSSASAVNDSPEVLQMTQAGIKEEYAIYALNKCNNNADLAFAFVIDHDMEKEMRSAKVATTVDPGNVRIDTCNHHT